MFHDAAPLRVAANFPGEAVDPTQQTRASTGTFLAYAMDPEGVLGWVEQRIAAATLLPADNGEAFNVLHYEKEQHYDSHYDTFDPKEFGPQPSQRTGTRTTVSTQSTRVTGYPRTFEILQNEGRPASQESRRRRIAVPERSAGGGRDGL
ncbi:hypothetical protein Vretifemale_18957 [Volvox reticuliferus]|uniref:Prolyl 4-hydroxylase alpha subunit Fe(2+) 2OG dioxygenase domain-containing protein n=2 Tax=Volvox reticuliferus TaxID=1737510 RepID=A0A8J4D0M0_9CHLO|nr:hypothetical protein Vretifemale_18957 [Volvox reticuliferus]